MGPLWFGAVLFGEAFGFVSVWLFRRRLAVLLLGARRHRCGAEPDSVIVEPYQFSLEAVLPRSGPYPDGVGGGIMHPESQASIPIIEEVQAWLDWRWLLRYAASPAFE